VADLRSTRGAVGKRGYLDARGNRRERQIAKASGGGRRREGIKEEATGMRSVRALRQLKAILDSLGGDWLEL
jgi:hypothetical protein